MAILVKPFTFTAGATIIASEHNADFDVLYNGVNGFLDNSNLNVTAAIDSSKVNLSIISQVIAMTGAILKFAQGTTVVSAATITLGDDGNFFKISGITNITSITIKSAGTMIMLEFEAALTVVDGLNLKLNGSFTTAAESTLMLVSDGTNWFELSRQPNVSSGGASADDRRELYVRQASVTTINAAPGGLNVNGQIDKTADTVLDLTVAADWAGGISLRAINTTGYVGVDTAGNIKMHTLAPTHSNYALTITTGTKRYVSWAGTTYRVIGWFRMNATGAGELDTFGVSNIADGTVQNTTTRIYTAFTTGATAIPDDDTIPTSTEGFQFMISGIVPTNINNQLLIECLYSVGNNSGGRVIFSLIQNSAGSSIQAGASSIGGSNNIFTNSFDHLMKAAAVSFQTFEVRLGDQGGSTLSFNGETGARKYGGSINSFIRITEIEAQLT